jgi:ABC-type polysaccharide/polyol phosphate export permease
VSASLPKSDLIDPQWCARDARKYEYGPHLTEITAYQRLAMQSETGFPSSVTGAAIAGFEELAGGVRHWRVSHLIGVRELRHRYARSKLGQFWLTLSTASMIGMLAAVWSLLWNQPIHELAPFIGVSLIIWNYLSQVLIDCTTVFSNQANLYLNQKMNFSVSIYSVIYKNTIMLAHSLIIIVVLIIAFGVPVNWYLLQIVPAFGLTLAVMMWVGYLIAMICVRYRDVVQVITTWFMVLLYITPVMWKPDFLPARYHLIVQLNPFAQLLEIMRSPFLGQPVSLYAWLSTAVLAGGGGLIAVAAIGRYRRRIIFWM